MSVDEKVKNVLASIFTVNAVNVQDDWGPDQIEGWDSLGHMALIVALEETFEVSFETSEIIEMDTVAHIKRILEDKLPDNANH